MNVLNTEGTTDVAKRAERSCLLETGWQERGGLRGYKFITNFYYYKEIIIFLSICIHKLKINILGSTKSSPQGLSCPQLRNSLGLSASVIETRTS